MSVVRKISAFVNWIGCWFLEVDKIDGTYFAANAWFHIVVIRLLLKFGSDVCEHLFCWAPPENGFELSSSASEGRDVLNEMSANVAESARFDCNIACAFVVDPLLSGALGVYASGAFHVKIAQSFAASS